MIHKILVIDDTSVIRTFLKDVLSDSGFEVHTAENGQIGYEMAMKENYSIIISDIHMPIMNGLEAIRLIKKAKPEVPVLMTDSFPDKMAEMATRAGALGCLAKPFTLDELRKTISQIMENLKVKTK